MSVTWENLNTQSEKKALAFFNSAKLTDSVVASDGEAIKNQLLGCYENFSSSQEIQAKVFELLGAVLSKSKKGLFTDENLVLTLHYAKSMMSEWISSSDVIVNVLKFLVVLLEKEKRGDADEELIEQCGDILKAHSADSPVQKMCLTFLCGVSKNCDVESFSESSVSALAHSVVETIRSSDDDLDIIIKGLVILSFLFERVPEHLHGASMDALDAVSNCLQKHEESPAVAAMAVEFLQLCAVEDTHFIILSSTDKGFGLYCDLCTKFLENSDINSVLSCIVLLKRSCNEKIKEITINSIPGLKKKVISVIGGVRDTAAANSIDAAPAAEDILKQIVFGCDGVLGALDPSYCPDSAMDVSYTSKGSLSRSVSSVAEVSAKDTPSILPRSNSAPLYARPKPPAAAAEHEEPVGSVASLLSLSSASKAAGGGSKKVRARRRGQNKARDDEADDLSQSSELSIFTPRSNDEFETPSLRPPKSPLLSKADSTSFSQAIQEEVKKGLCSDDSASEVIITASTPEDCDQSAVDDAPAVKTPVCVPPLKIVADIAPEKTAMTSPPRKDPLLDKLRSFQTVISRSNTARSTDDTPLTGRDAANQDKEITSLMNKLNEAETKNQELSDRCELNEQQLNDSIKEMNELQNRLTDAGAQNTVHAEDSIIINDLSEKLQASTEENAALKDKCEEVRLSAEADREAASQKDAKNAAEIFRLSQEQDDVLLELRNLKSSLEQGSSAEEAKIEAAARDVEELKKQRASLESDIHLLQTSLDEARSASVEKEESIIRLTQDKHDAITELAALRLALEGTSVEDAKLQAALIEVQELKEQIESLNSDSQALQVCLDEVRAEKATSEEQATAEINCLLQEKVEYIATKASLEEKISEFDKVRVELEESKKSSARLLALSTRSQEQASVAVLRVEELHSVLMEATAKIESLMDENGALKEELGNALKREETLVQEQEDLIAAYRAEGDDQSTTEVTIIGDDDEKIIIPLNGEVKEVFEAAPSEHSTPTQIDDDQDNDDINDYYEDIASGQVNDHGEVGDGLDSDYDSLYHDQSMRSQKRKKTPTQSAAAGIRSALSYLGIDPIEQSESNDAGFDVLVEDLAELSQQYFQAIVKCPTSDPAKSINHTLRSNALCAALSMPELGLVDNKKLLRSDVEIAIKRQKGVRLFTVYGATFTLVMCIYKKHKLDTNDNDAQTLLFRLIEILTVYLQNEEVNDKVWIQSSCNQRQGLSSPSRRNNASMEVDNGDEQYTPQDLMAASRLLTKEIKSLESIFECYPSYASSSRSSKAIGDSDSVRGRSLDTVILIAKDFGICPSLMDRTQCIHIIGQEIRRSQDDPDWVCPAGDILVSFSQFQIFLMNVALKNKSFGPSNGFVTATQKLAGLLWWMDNSGAKERLRDKDRNFKVCPFRVHGLIPTLKATPRGEDYWLEK